MDFDYTPQEAAFRQELHAWLLANPPEGYNPDTFLHLEQDARFAIQLNWQKQLHSAGWVGIHLVVSGGKRGIDGGYWMHCALSTHLFTIAGGTSEIQRNILGERVLGLPKG